MNENETRQGQTTRPAGKNQNRNTGAAGKRKRRPQSASKRDFKNNVQKSAEPEGQKSVGQNTKRRKQEHSPVSEKNRNPQNRRGGVKGTSSGNAQKNSNHRGNRKGPPKIHDDYDDIRSYGGRYLQLPDYDELETDSLSNVGLV